MNYLGLDTETINGKCRLLCLSDGSIFKIRSAKDVRAFLDQWEAQDFVAFNADYDIQSLMVYLPRGIVDDLLKGFPAEYEGLTLVYVKDKFFKFDDNVIYDCYQFYQMGLDRAAKKYLGEGKGDVDAAHIAKENIYSQQVIDYCIRDAQLVLKLFNVFHDALPDSVKDVPPLSNAYYSGKYFKDELKANRKIPVNVNREFRKIYYGARNEILERGHYPEGLWYYDISGAYPYEIAMLPALKDPYITRGKSYCREAAFSVYHVKAFIPDPYVSPILSKMKGLSVYPVGHFDGLISKPEYERIKDYPHRIVSGQHIIPGEVEYPFKEKIDKLWGLRKTVPNPLPVKVIMNSLYGKMASAVPKWRGSGWKGMEGCIDVEWNRDGKVFYLVEDIFNSNFVYASHITAKVRCRMYDLIKEFPKDIVAVQTDSVMSKAPLPLRVTDKLGDWKVEFWDEAYVLGSGVYFFRIGNEWEGKFRGFNFPKDRLPKVMHDLLTGKGPSVEFGSKKRVSLQESRRIDDDALANVIMDVTKRLNINFDKKRVWGDVWKSGSEIKTKRIVSKPHFFYRPDVQLELNFKSGV